MIDGLRRRAGRPPARLVAILLAYALLALGFNLATPVGEGPDEPEHLAFVQHLRRTGRLPVAPAEAGEGLIQAKHPPLYYAAGALLSLPWDIERLGFVPNPFFSFNLDDPGPPNALLHLSRERFPYHAAPEFLAVRVMRLLSLLLGLVTVAASWRLARRVWPSRPALAALTASLVAFLPGFLFGSAVFSNDAAANAGAALVLLGALALADPRSGRREAWTAGLALGLALLSKLTTLPLVGVLGLAWLLRSWPDRDPRAALGSALRVALSAALVSGWWFLRNMWLYGPGDPLGWRRFSGRAAELARELPLSRELPIYLWVQLDSFWGWFGWLALRTAEWQYLLVRALLLLALTGLLLLPMRGPAARAGLSLRGLVLVVATIGAVYAMVFRLALDMNLVVAHGRLLYTALPALALLTAIGLLGWLPRRWETPAAGLLSLLLLGAALQSLLGVLLPAYRAPEPSPIGMPADARPSPFTFVDPRAEASEAVRLLGYRLEPEGDAEEGLEEVLPLPRIVLSGEAGAAPPRLSGELLWQADGDIRAHRRSGTPGLVATAELVDRRGGLLGRWEAAPFDGRHPFLAWQPGEVYALPLDLPVARDAGWGLVELRVGVQPEGRPGQRLPATGPGARDGWAPVARYLVVDPRWMDQPAPRPGRVLARFGPASELELLAVDRETRGETLRLDLRWRLVEGARPDARLGDATVFLHLLDAEGGLVATADGPPAGGRYPIAHWMPGRVLLDRHELGWPPEGARAAPDPSTLQLELGLYDLRSGERMPARGPEGERLADEALRLPARPAADGP